MNILDLYEALPEFQKISGTFSLDELTQASRYFHVCKEELLSKYNPTGYLIMLLKTGIIEDRIKIARNALQWKKKQQMAHERDNDEKVDYKLKKALCSALCELIDETGPYSFMKDDASDWNFNFRISAEDTHAFLCWSDASNCRSCLNLPYRDKNFLKTIDMWCKKLLIPYDEKVLKRYQDCGVQINHPG